MHPRDWGRPGRIKIELYDDFGNACNPDILTKKVMMFKLLEWFPKLKSRVNQPPLEVLDEAKKKQLEIIDKEKREKAKTFLKQGGASASKSIKKKKNK